jgi:hypothetical protein
MKDVHLIIFACCLVASSIVSAQPFASWSNGELQLNNGIVERIIQLPQGAGSFITT